MIEIHTRATSSHSHIDDTVTLDFDTRQKSRIKTHTDGGLSIGIFTERGKPLLIDEILLSDCGKAIRVQGELEPVITAHIEDWLTFSKVCYHLGNRHTRLQVGERWLRFQPDHVLTSLVEQYGLSVDDSPAIFEPESGAYSIKGAAHSSSHHHHD